MASIDNLHTDNLTTETRPEHHVHKSSEPLPGARGGAPAVDYTAEHMERLPSSVWQDADASQPTREAAELTTAKPDLERSNSGSGRTAFSGERPLNTEPHPEGGVAIDGGNEGMAMGKASAADKLIGKAQKVVGKLAHKPEMHEKGELRESGGKAAAAGAARAPMTKNANVKSCIITDALHPILYTSCYLNCTKATNATRRIATT
ncbi:hypothetical protein C8F04DRAFT_170361 [Mycena alexandri]|uniref:Uncharacterized protein n=1 Tax=Mycena alexandri TaxID=1745969 RepID=A0AAD6T7A0_9AGAR|nr:hypothetical protein C8F04DRAFT_170361 [Mycena alexandri]